jgi:hypothetical protein
MNNLPIYKLSLSDDPESGVDYIALVDDPAIEKHFLAFSKQQELKLQFKATNPEKRVISGPLMIADMCIFRDDPQHGAHYVYFDSETIRQIIFRFFRKGLTSNINLMHLPDARPEGIFMFESFIIDSQRGVAGPGGFAPLPDGSWFGSFKIDNDLVWEHFIRTGEFKGFSVEGFFNYEQPQSREELQLREIMSLVQDTDAD